MDSYTILFDSNGNALAPDDIRRAIARFPFGYKVAIDKTITYSSKLDENGVVFLKCAKNILSSFGMTRRGPFFGSEIDQKLLKCWDRIKADLLEIKKLIPETGLLRDRYLLELSDSKREELIMKIWYMAKKILPITMGATSYGLVGASKILFSVLPEIVLPVDNNQWLNLFKTVDLGDVIRDMASEIQKWEEKTKERLNEMDSIDPLIEQKRLTTLPSIYNVMAMKARPSS